MLPKTPIKVMVGGRVWFRHAGRLWCGTVLKVSKKSISVMVHGKRWHVAYTNIEFVEDSKMWITKTM